jgi:hypothetical protein
MRSELKNVDILKSIVSLSIAEGIYDVMYSRGNIMTFVLNFGKLQKTSRKPNVCRGQEIAK